MKQPTVVDHSHSICAKCLTSRYSAPGQGNSRSGLLLAFPPPPPPKERSEEPSGRCLSAPSASLPVSAPTSMPRAFLSSPSPKSERMTMRRQLLRQWRTSGTVPVMRLQYKFQDRASREEGGSTHQRGVFQQREIRPRQAIYLIQSYVVLVDAGW